MPYGMRGPAYGPRQHDICLLNHQILIAIVVDQVFSAKCFDSLILFAPLDIRSMAENFFISYRSRWFLFNFGVLYIILSIFCRRGSRLVRSILNMNGIFYKKSFLLFFRNDTCQ